MPREAPLQALKQRCADALGGDFGAVSSYLKRARQHFALFITMRILSKNLKQSPKKQSPTIILVYGFGPSVYSRSSTIRTP